jgi:hypothetical protein
MGYSPSVPKFSPNAPANTDKMQKGGIIMKINWETEYEKALERSRDERKFIFLDFFTPQ